MNQRAGRTCRPAGPKRLPDPRVVATEIQGPEDVVADAEGRIFTGSADGTLWRLTLSDTGVGRAVAVARTGGRPLGLEPTPDGRLLVCDAQRGLLRVDPQDGTVGVLANKLGGESLRFCSNVAAAADGTIYFSVSSRRYGLEDWMGDILEHTGTGQLLRLRPGGEPEVLLDGLQFANGVALAEDESFVVVAENGAYRLCRLRLTGPQAGRYDRLVSDLPGFPDNISRGRDGVFWVALAGPRERGIEVLHRTTPKVRKAVWHGVKPFPVRVMALRSDGALVCDLRRAGSPYRMVTSVCRSDAFLIMGSLTERGVAVCEVDG
ncbi:SMP-30/gluconolactonase/LRE family protein [Streptomyces decoyicus]|uniref:SMP-30/gluconolactonase/LRE family protein n=1 Tax=Streptomyces decoyicus TaxID=249567 RepID=A0ABZ1F8V5_9ACTN|nr:SMP-30/gluconolactonase/LRE family protein [Streptomyces decoyicus]WSB66641.1 SMP-30/gluconolactonase/LRE family protein [Streptomyces decoyicus]